MFKPDLLRGKRVLITGGGTGLGRSISRRYLELGAEVIICGRRAEVLEGTVKELADATGGKASFTTCDVRNAEQVEAMFEKVWKERPADILVNNAAANFIARTEKLSPRAIDAVLNIVLHGTFYCTVAAGRRWIDAQRGGTILSVATTTSFTGHAFTVPSAAAKAGIVAMTRSLAAEWGPKGIRLNAVAPGLFPTPGAFDRLYPDPAQADAEKKLVPLGRYGEHSELANLFAYLASDEAGYITGELVVMDGGRWMGGVGGGAVRDMHTWTDKQWEEKRKI